MDRRLLQYGLCEGHLKYIEDVPNGLACGCKCPDPRCNADLIARHEGKKNTHHFAHVSGVDCPGARMSALHLLAQQIIQKERKILLPPFKGDIYNKEWNEPVEFTIVDLERQYAIDDVQNRQPDCVGTKIINGKTHSLWIEIFVTHAVDDEKRTNIRSIQQPCVEIDLSDLLNTDYDENLVRDRLMSSSLIGWWISCPKCENIDAKKVEIHKKKVEEYRLRKAEEERKNHEQIEIRQNELKSLVEEWKINSNAELTQKIISEISDSPFGGKPVHIQQFILPNWNFMEYINTAPKNHFGLDVFYTLMHYYWNESIRYTNALNQFLYKSYQLSQPAPETSIVIEEVVSWRVISSLATASFNKKLIQAYIKQQEVRIPILNILSFYYHHLLGTSCLTYERLAEDILMSTPELANDLKVFVDADNKKKRTPVISISSDIYQTISTVAAQCVQEQKHIVSKILSCAFLNTYYEKF